MGVGLKVRAVGRCKELPGQGSLWLRDYGVRAGLSP